MPRGGRPPKPTALKILEGYRKDRIGTLRTVAGAPECPAYLPADAKQVWKSVVKEFDRIHMLSKIDGPALETYCMNVSIFRKAARKVLKEGLMLKGDKGVTVRNPALIPMKDAADKIKVLAREFGLTPSARSAMNSPEVSEEELEDILTPRRAKA